MFTLCSYSVYIATIESEDASVEAIVAAPDVAEEHQHLAEEEAEQDANLNSDNYTTNQGKPRCISPIIPSSLSHVYICIFVHLRFIGVDWS